MTALAEAAKKLQRSTAGYGKMKTCGIYESFLTGLGQDDHMAETRQIKQSALHLTFKLKKAQMFWFLQELEKTCKNTRKYIDFF